MLCEWEGEGWVQGSEAETEEPGLAAWQDRVFLFLKSEELDGSEPRHRKAQRETAAGTPVDEGGPSYLWGNGKETTALRERGDHQWARSELLPVRSSLNPTQ